MVNSVNASGLQSTQNLARPNQNKVNSEKQAEKNETTERSITDDVNTSDIKAADETITNLVDSDLNTESVFEFAAQLGKDIGQQAFSIANSQPQALQGLLAE